MSYVFCYKAWPGAATRANINFSIFNSYIVSSVQQTTTNTPTSNKQTDMLPTSNIIYSMNKHGFNSDFEKLKQEEVSLLSIDLVCNY